jgi:hypothetical protein
VIDAICEACTHVGIEAPAYDDDLKTIAILKALFRNQDAANASGEPLTSRARDKQTRNTRAKPTGLLRTLKRSGVKKVVPAAWVEPATFRSGGERSNPLSYAGMLVCRRR